MKIIGLILVLILALSACAPPQDSQPVIQATEGTPTSPLEISAGPICPAYTPTGDVTYASEWTGAYPEIEKYNKSYRTATFGMG